MINFCYFCLVTNSLLFIKNFFISGLKPLLLLTMNNPSLKAGVTVFN